MNKMALIDIVCNDYKENMKNLYLCYHYHFSN